MQNQKAEKETKTIVRSDLDNVLHFLDHHCRDEPWNMSVICPRLVTINGMKDLIMHAIRPYPTSAVYKTFGMIDPKTGRFYSKWMNCSLKSAPRWTTIDCQQYHSKLLRQLYMIEATRELEIGGCKNPISFPQYVEFEQEIRVKLARGFRAVFYTSQLATSSDSDRLSFTSFTILDSYQCSFCHQQRQQSFGEKPKPFAHCSVCCHVFYCSIECQRADWSRHRHCCQPFE